MRHRLGLATRTQISVCKSPFPSAGTAVSLFRAKTVQTTVAKGGRNLVAGLWGHTLGENLPPVLSKLLTGTKHARAGLLLISCFDCDS